MPGSRWLPGLGAHHPWAVRRVGWAVRGGALGAARVCAGATERPAA